MENPCLGYETILNVFVKLYRGLSRGPLPVVLLWIVVIVVLTTFSFTGFGFGNIWNRTENRLVSIPGSESYRATNLLAQNESTSYTVYLLVDGVDMDKQHREVLNVLQTATKNLQEIPGVIPAGVLHPFAAGDDATDAKAAELMKEFIAKDKHGFLMITLLDLTQFPERAKEIREMAETEMRQVAKDMRSFAPQARGLVNDRHLNNEAIGTTAKTDTHLATIVSFILITVIMFLASGSFSMTFLVLASCAAGWAISRAFANLVSIFIAPSPEDPALVTIIALVSITGYTILLQARARTRLILIKYTAEIPTVRKSTPGKPQKRRSRRAATGSPLDEVFAHSVAPILTSTGLITLGLTTVAVFPAVHLRWTALVSILSIWGCSIAALSLIPALLYLTITWIESPRPQWHRAVFNRFSAVMIKTKDQILSPIRAKFNVPQHFIMVFVCMVIVIMTIPVFGISWNTSGADALSSHSPTARFHALRQAQYGSTGATSDAIVLGKTTSAELASWGGRALKIPGVANTIVNPESVGDYAVLDVTFSPNLSKRESVKVVNELRDLPSSFPKLVTGQTANEIDFANQLLRYVPPSALVMTLATLFIITIAIRRLGVALVTTGMNLIILLSSLGITTVVFQDGAGCWLPFLPNSGGVEPNTAVLLVGYGFAIALDYQFYVIGNSLQGDVFSPVEDTPYLQELTQSRGILWTKSIISLTILLSFLPITTQAVKQPVFAFIAVLLGHAMLNRILLAPLLKPFPDQLPVECNLIWKD